MGGKYDQNTLYIDFINQYYIKINITLINKDIILLL